KKITRDYYNQRKAYYQKKLEPTLGPKWEKKFNQKYKIKTKKGKTTYYKTYSTKTTLTITEDDKIKVKLK
ncbi:MAG: hypothetical protein ABIH38_04590, partial [Patescibacteria group bacterium]